MPYTYSLIEELFSLTLVRIRREKQEQRRENWEMWHIHTPCLFRLWTGRLWLSGPRLLAFRRVCRHGVTANLTGGKGTGKKKRNHARSASVLLPVVQWLDSQCCWQQFYSEPAPPCRLCAGSPVCCVGALPPGHTSARGILHTIAPLFGCHPCAVCIWPHSNSVWAPKLWRILFFLPAVVAW